MCRRVVPARTRRSRGETPRLQQIVACVIGLSAHAALAAPLPEPGAPEWQPLEFRSIERASRYTAVDIDGVRAWHGQSDCSSSAYFVTIDDPKLQNTRVLSWRWQLVRPLNIDNERTKEGDDFAARVYVLFEFQPERASVWERARRAVGERLYGAKLPGDAINYVWASREPVGAEWDNPYTASSKMRAVASGPSSGWQSVRVDLNEDYQRLFGHPRPPIVGIAVMTDSDGSCTKAGAYFADFELLSPSDSRKTE